MLHARLPHCMTNDSIYVSRGGAKGVVLRKGACIYQSGRVPGRATSVYDVDKGGAPPGLLRILLLQLER